MSSRLNGRVAVITGASRGNGNAIANAYAKEGAHIVIADVNIERAELAAKTIRESGGSAQAVQVNVTDCGSVQNLFEQVIKDNGKIDILVNNAGVIGRFPLQEITEAEWDRVLDINLKGTFLCAQAAAKHMVPQQSGVIINISSVNAESLNPTTIHYCVSKGGVKTLTKGLALSLAKEGVRVNAIGPGPVYTDMSRDRLDDPEGLKATEAHIPMGRVARPNDLIGAAVFLASDESAYVTGHTLYVDGGWLTM